MNSQIYSEVRQGLKKTAAFDCAAFERLTDDTDPEVTLKVLAHFCMTLEEVLLRVAEGIQHENPELVWKACHKIAGSAELVGFNRFGIYSRSLNTAIRAMNDLHAHRMDIDAYLREGKDLAQDIRSVFPSLKDFI